MQYHITWSGCLPSAISMALEAAAAAIAAVPIWSKRPRTKVLPSWVVNDESGDSSQLEATSNNGLPHDTIKSHEHHESYMVYTYG